jgi:hypothetical protein
MTRKTVTLAIILALAFIWAALSFAQEDMRTVDNTVFGRPARPPAVFDHDIHNEDAGLDDCGICHHVYVDGRRSETQTSEDQSCSECHSPSGKGPNPIPLRRAFHLNCKGCHTERSAGPVMCAECHPRQ